MSYITTKQSLATMNVQSRATPGASTIFSYATYPSLSACACTCREWRDIIESMVMASLWKTSYEKKTQCPCLHGFKKNERLNWRHKFYDIMLFLRGGSKSIAYEDLIDDFILTEPRNLTSRSGHSALLFHVGPEKREVLVLFGGATHFFRLTNTVDIISLDANWPSSVRKRVMGRTPSPRWIHASCMVFDNTAALVFGGKNFETLVVNPDLYILKLVEISGELVVKSFLVECHGPVPSRRSGHTMLTIPGTNNCIVFGGSTESNPADVANFSGLNDVYVAEISWNDVDGSQDEVYRADWKKITCSGDLPSPRWHHSAVVSNNTMVVFGGWRKRSPQESDGDGLLQRTNSSHEFLNDVHILNMDTWVWKRITTSGITPNPRCQAPAFLIRSEYTYKKPRDESDGGTWSPTSISGLIRPTSSSSISQEDYCINSPATCRAEDSADASCHSDISSITRACKGGSKGYMVVYGGACHHHTNTFEGGDPYGSVVVDLHDLKILDLDTFTWLPVSFSYPRCRGGVNAATHCSHGWVISGGMHSDTGSDEPRFKNDLVLFKLNVGEGTAHFKDEPDKSWMPRVNRTNDVRVMSRIFNARA